jgi:hypothetical protein
MDPIALVVDMHRSLTVWLSQGVVVDCAKRFDVRRAFTVMGIGQKTETALR